MIKSGHYLSFTLVKLVEILMRPKNPSGREALVQDVGGKCQYSKHLRSNSGRI